ncbi:hypothetical protein FA592_11700 [Sulfurospirillum diekertiae]|uniref:Uncharacterized protein n=1 Tax=Sulfurospirillum diekertiae TaxID=1854492 RepID=A0A290HCE1_9BACT|nr:hypothetical protein [Sulfurospirillum diekertiae]ATB69212.1 hypothetical protein SJPD1_1100 [Sulfurospirillum diekertiae]QIR76861.1 hypothetical protein FA584_11910 [Sulfurospirillum diekertiae]QIR79479.1 hypothetical protein FA592_11700 [Sulfurospirillum diekertiae]
MNHELYVTLPKTTIQILEKLLNRDWIIHAFNVEDHNAIYTLESIPDILYNNRINRIQYILYLDTNIYQYLLNSHKKSPTKETRDAVALLVFCQLCDIEIEPSLAAYEKINYIKDNANEVVDDLMLFYRIDNTKNDALMAYAIGNSNEYPLAEHPNIDKEVLKNNLIKYNRLTEWDSIYLIVLVCIAINQEKISSYEKLKKFKYWMLKDFRQSLVCFVYAIIFFSKTPLKKMMKYKATNLPEQKKQQIFNMTWDLYIMNSFIRNWIPKQKTKEFIYATDDKAFKKLLNIATQIQILGDYTPFKETLHKADYENLIKIWDITIPDSERIYQSEKWTPEYRKELIQKYELELLS